MGGGREGILMIGKGVAGREQEYENSNLGFVVREPYPCGSGQITLFSEIWN